MIRLIAIAGLASSTAVSGQALTPAPIVLQPDGMITKIAAARWQDTGQRCIRGKNHHPPHPPSRPQMCDRNDLLALMLQWRSEIGSADRFASSGLFSERLGNLRLGGRANNLPVDVGGICFFGTMEGPQSRYLERSSRWRRRSSSASRALLRFQLIRSHIAVGALVYWQRKTTFWRASTSRSLVRMVCVPRNVLVEER
jgi:hypothetical protein